jgi:hypothetical protein
MENGRNTQYDSATLQVDQRRLWREHILGQYLRGEISRDEAVNAVGVDWVDLAERQHKAMVEDLSWASDLGLYSVGERNEV